MKYYKDNLNVVYGYESDGSQDLFINPSLIPITEEQALAILAPSLSDRIAAAHARINAAYEAAFAALVAGYPPSEVASWQQQKEEAVAWKENDDDGDKAPWVKGAASARGISVADMVNKIKRKADTFSPAYGELTGKRQRLRDAIDALGSSPTQAQLDAIQW